MAHHWIICSFNQRIDFSNHLIRHLNRQIAKSGLKYFQIILIKIIQLIHGLKLISIAAPKLISIANCWLRLQSESNSAKLFLEIQNDWEAKQIAQERGIEEKQLIKLVIEYHDLVLFHVSKTTWCDHSFFIKVIWRDVCVTSIINAEDVRTLMPITSIQVSLQKSVFLVNKLNTQIVFFSLFTFKVPLPMKPSGNEIECKCCIQNHWIWRKKTLNMKAVSSVTIFETSLRQIVTRQNEQNFVIFAIYQIDDGGLRRDCWG